jgi:long-subunit fatty acid transport protein
MKKTQKVLAVLALLGGSPCAMAIADLETNASLPFSFANPGARSLGMGGAFVGLADDATGAYTNPAGLTQLAQKEVSLEFRHTRFDVPYLNGGGATALDPFDGSGLNYSSATSSSNRPSFAAFVWPHEGWALALYRHEVSNYRGTFQSAGAALVDHPGIRPFLSKADLRIVDYGLSGAWKLNDMVSLGAGLGFYQFDFDTMSGRFNPPSLVLANTQMQHGKDNAVGYNLGARFSFDEHWSAGLVYRHAPEFTYEAASYANTPDAPPVLLRGLDHVRFDVPDVFGAGISWRPSEQLVIDLDVDHVRYSELTDNVQSVYTDADIAATYLHAKDGYELRLGGEYTFAQFAHPFSLRAGVWREPAHGIRFEGQPSLSDQSQLVKKAQFGASRGQVMHGAFGAGWSFTKFQLDFAADLSEAMDSYTVSGVYRF